MAEYIDRNLIEWYGCNFEEPSCKYRECSGCSHAECSHTQIMQIPTADVIERSEYDELQEKYFKAIHNHTECLKKLHEYRSKVNKAIEEMEGEYSTCNQDWIDGLNRGLEILKKNIERG